MKSKVSFWLIPAEEDRAFFQEIINTLSQEYDAPSFTPHVTIYAGDSTPDESPDSLLEQATQGVQKFSLEVDKFLYSDEFTKSLFVQFQPNSILSQISETLRESSSKPSDYVLNPHLSLIYQYLSETIKKNLTMELPLPKSEVFFDEVQAISTPAVIQTREDVEGWEVIATKKLQ